MIASPERHWLRSAAVERERTVSIVMLRGDFNVKRESSMVGTWVLGGWAAAKRVQLIPLDWPSSQPKVVHLIRGSAASPLLLHVYNCRDAGRDRGNARENVYWLLLWGTPQENELRFLRQKF